VIVKITVAGLCGSDLHLFRETEPGLDPGTIMGHEFVGVVHEVGAAITKLKIGDRVLSPFSVLCGECYFCQHLLPGRCIHVQVYGWVSGGKGIQGAQAEYVRVPLADTTLSIIPPDITDEEGLFIGDIFATGYFCADNSDITIYKTLFPNSPVNVAVMGCGPVGLMGIISAFSLGATQVFAVDSISERLDFAQKFGAIPVNLAKENILEKIKQKTDQRGVDCVMEAVGSQEALKMAFKMVRPGGTISVVGVQTEDSYVAFQPVEAYDKNVTYKIGRCSAKNYQDRLIKIIREKKHDVTKIISHRIGFNSDEEVKKVYQIFNNRTNNCTKVVFYPSKKSSL